jgi:hypothetical protein
MLNAYWSINNYKYIINQCMHRKQACRLSGTTVPWANLHRYSIYTGSTVYTTPVMCRARPYTSNVVDQTTSTVRYLARCTKQPIPRSLTVRCVCYRLALVLTDASKGSKSCAKVIPDAVINLMTVLYEYFLRSPARRKLCVISWRWKRRLIGREGAGNAYNLGEGEGELPQPQPTNNQILLMSWSVLSLYWKSGIA